MSSEQLQYEILQYINTKRKVETIEEITDHCKERDIDKDEIENSIRELHDKKLIKGIIPLTNSGRGFEGHNIKITTEGKKQISKQNGREEIPSITHNHYINNGSISGNMGPNNGSIVVNNNIDQNFEKLYKLLQKENIKNNQEIIDELKIARKVNKVKSIKKIILEKIIPTAGNIASIGQLAFAIIEQLA